MNIRKIMRYKKNYAFQIANKSTLKINIFLNYLP